MRILDVIRAVRWRHIGDAILWLGLTFSTGLFFFLASYLLLPYLGIRPELRALTSHGELALYSISLLGGAVYVVLRGIKVTGLPEATEADKPLNRFVELLRSISFPGAALFILLILGLTLSSSVVFAGSVAANALGIGSAAALQRRIFDSVYLMLGATAIGFLVVLFEAVANSASRDYRDLMDEQFDDFASRFDKRAPRGSVKQ